MPAKTFSAEAKQAFREMLFHKLKTWDAADALEKAIGADVDSGTIDGLAVFFGDTDAVTRMTDAALTEVMTEWMERFVTDEEDTDD